MNSPLTNCHKIVGAVDYSIHNVLPYLAKELDVPVLIPCMGAEKCISNFSFSFSKDVTFVTNYFSFL